LKVHESGAQRIGVLGLSFKPGTDDLRESPAITLIRELWQDGYDVVVHDPDVKLDRMLGANREYLERQLPQIGQILRPHIGDLLKESQVLVVTQMREEFTSALACLDGQIKVIDLVGRNKEHAPLSLAAHKGHSL
jgi:GDP-mannose 6-dehydrogenase